MLHQILNIPLLAFLVAAVTIDGKTRRIPNALTLPIMGAALVWHFADAGASGLMFSLGGLAAGLGLMLVPFLMGGLGGGDVKMLAAVGAVKGAWFVFTAFLCMGVAGGLMGLVFALCHGRLKATLRNMKDICILLYFHTNPRVAAGSQSGAAGAFPYAGAIAIGVLLSYILTPWLFGGTG